MTAEEIETKAEQAKQKILNKLNKKNNIPSKVEEVGAYENTNKNLSEKPILLKSIEAKIKILPKEK